MQQLGVALAAVQQCLAARRHRRPHLGDVAGDHDSTCCRGWRCRSGTAAPSRACRRGSSRRRRSTRSAAARAARGWPTARRSRNPSPGLAPGWRGTGWRGCPGRAWPGRPRWRSSPPPRRRCSATGRRRPTARDVATHTWARKRTSPATSLAKRRVAMRAPYTRPTSWNGSAIAAATPRARSSSPNACSYSSDARTTKPMSDTARNGSDHQIRRSVGTLWAMRQLSANDGAISSVSIDLGQRPDRLALPPAADRFAEAQGEDGDDQRRDDEHEERHAPAEGEGEHPGRQRPDEAADGVGRAVRAVHRAARLDRVVVGEQRVVRRVDHRLADGAAAAGDGQHDERHRPDPSARRTPPRRGRRR